MESLEGFSSDTMDLPSAEQYNLQHFLKKLCTPEMPLVSQGLLCSIGPNTISYNLNVSAP